MTSASFPYTDDASDMPDGIRYLTVVLLDRHGVEIARKHQGFTGDDKRSEESGVMRLAKEAYRDAFYDRSRTTPYVAPKPITRSYLWGLFQVSRSPYA